MHKICSDERKCAVMKGRLCSDELKFFLSQKQLKVESRGVKESKEGFWIVGVHKGQ